MALPTPRFWTCGLQNHEGINFCEAPQAAVICYGCPGTLSGQPLTLPPISWA